MIEITIPVLNEEKKLSQGIVTLHEYLTGIYEAKEWKLIIADNGSQDRTSILASELSEQYSNIECFEVATAGVGLALKNSWDKSKAEIVGFMDLDLATDLKHIPMAISAIEEDNYDFVYGTRLHKEYKVIGRPISREVMSRIFNFVLKRILKVRISDGFCGFKFLKRNIWSSLKKAGANNDGWFFSPELVIVADFLDKKLLELPVTWTHGRDSRVRVIKHTLHSIKGIRKMKKVRENIL